MGRILGIDFGEKRIGLSLSDESQIIASPFKTLQAGKTDKETAQTIYREVAERGPISQIVLGLPLMMNGTESPMSKKVRAFAKELEVLFDVTVTLWDERLTSAMVEKTLKAADVSRKKRTGLVDSMAAGAILQSYLDSPRIQ